MAASDATVELDVSDAPPPKKRSSNLLAGLFALIKKITGIKAVLFAFTTILILYEGTIPFHGYIDNRLFHLSSRLKAEPPVKNEPVIITLTPFEMETLQRAPDNLPGFLEMISKIHKTKPSSIALIVDELPLLTEDLSVRKIEKKISDSMVKAPANEKKRLTGILQFSQKYLVRGKGLANSLNKANVIIAVRQSTVPDIRRIRSGRYVIDSTIKVSPSPITTYLEKLPPEALPSEMPELILKTEDTVHTQTVAPVMANGFSAQWPLIWKQGENYLPDLCTLMYSRILDDTAEWKTSAGVMFGFSFVETDTEGFVKPLYSMSERRQGNITHHTFKQLKKKTNLPFFKNRPVFIGAEDDPSVSEAANVLLSLTSGAVSHTPYQAIWLGKAFIILFFLYLVLIVPLLKPGVSVLISMFMVFIIFILQIGVHLIKGKWLMFTTPALFLITGHVLMLIWLHLNRRYFGLIQRADKAFYELGSFQYEQSRYDQAFESLQQCWPKEPILELIYKLGVSLERKRQFDKACSVFTYIVEHNPGHRDSRERAERISNMLFGRTSTDTSGTPGTIQFNSPGISPVLGRYEIERELGRGAMGIVYLGQDPKINRKIAIKTMDFTQTFEGRFDEVKDRFFREAMAAGRLTHPNIVTIFDAGEEQDLAYIAMDYVPGKTMSEFTKSEHLLPAPVVFDLIRHVADALDYAHKQNIIHRDIKPGNIIYNPDDNSVKVTDFGIARIADTTTTRPGVVLGSPSYMSPEQLRGKEIDGRADIFSLGVTLFQLLTGKLPFTGTDLSSLGYQITSVKHASVLSLRADLPKSVEGIINKSLQKNPDKRYKTAGGMARSLKHILSD